MHQCDALVVSHTLLSNIAKLKCYTRTCILPIIRHNMSHWISHLDLVSKIAACIALLSYLFCGISTSAIFLLLASGIIFVVTFAVLTYITARKYVQRWVFGHHQCIFADCTALTLYPMKFKPAICLPVFVCNTHIDALQRGRFVPTGNRPVKRERDVSVFNPAVIPAAPLAPPEDASSSVGKPERVLVRNVPAQPHAQPQPQARQPKVLEDPGSGIM